MSRRRSKPAAPAPLRRARRVLLVGGPGNGQTVTLDAGKGQRPGCYLLLRPTLDRMLRCVAENRLNEPEACGHVYKVYSTEARYVGPEPLVSKRGIDDAEPRA